jgi:hypothetical protein
MVMDPREQLKEGTSTTGGLGFSPKATVPSTARSSFGAPMLSRMFPTSEDQSALSPSTTMSPLTSFTMIEDDEGNETKLKDLVAMKPAVICCESSKLYSSKRIIRHLHGVEAEWPDDTTLSIFRRPRDKMTYVELLSHRFANKILASQGRQSFPFTVKLSNNIIFQQSHKACQWLKNGASCLLKIDMPHNDEGISTITKL